MKPSSKTHWSILELTISVWIVTTMWALLGPVTAPQYCPFTHNNRWSALVLIIVCIIWGFVAATVFALTTLTAAHFLLRNSVITITLFPVGFLTRSSVAKTFGELFVVLLIMWLITAFVAPELRIR